MVAKFAMTLPRFTFANVDDAVAKMFAAFTYPEMLRFVVVAPERVSIEKIEVDAAFKTLNAKPLIGVWSVVVAP